MSTSVDVRFQRVATGLKLIYTSLVLTIMFVALTVAGSVAFAMSRAGQPPAGPGGGAAFIADNPTIVVGVLAISIVINLISIFGKVACLNVPEKTQATGPIYVAVTLTIVGIILSLGQQFAGLPKETGSIASLLHAASWFCFLVFLRRLAEFLGDREQGERARSLFTGSIIAGGLFIAAIVGTVLAGAGMIDRGFATFAGFGMFGVMIYGVILFLRYATLVKNLQLDLDRVLISRSLE